MNQAEKETITTQLKDEDKALKDLEKAYKKALKDTQEKIRLLNTRSDLQNAQSVIYQKKYQQAIKKQINDVLDALHNQTYTSANDFFTGSYQNGYVGSMYELQSRGIPLTIPVRTSKMMTAIQTKSKLSQTYYEKQGLSVQNIRTLKKQIAMEITRGIASGKSWLETAESVMIQRQFQISKSDAMRICRTEGNRINQQARLDAGDDAVDAGCDLLKQWDATLDNVTREDHRIADGQIVEWDEDFTVGGEKMSAPSVGGSAKQVCNCRCQLLKRPRWALDEEELEALKKRASYYNLDKSKSFEDYKQKYLKLPANAQTVPKIPIDTRSLKDRLSECKTSADVSRVSQEYFRNKEGCKIRDIDLSNLPPNVSKELVEHLDDLDDRFYSSLISVKSRSLPNSLGGKCTPTNASFTKYLMTGDPRDLESEIVLNSKYLKSNKIIMSDFLANHRSKYGNLAHSPWINEKYAVVSTLTHEYGHSILAGKANEIFVDDQGGKNPVFMGARRMYRMYMRELERLNKEIQEVRFQFAGQTNGLEKGIKASEHLQNEYDSKCISQYSRQSVGEFIAESFCDAELSSKPRSISLKMYDLLKGSFGKGNEK